MIQEGINRFIEILSYFMQGIWASSELVSTLVLEQIPYEHQE
jgi:hypothetical protein